MDIGKELNTRMDELADEIKNLRTVDDVREEHVNPYAPKYYIWVAYPNGNSQVVTAGNSSPAKAATFSDSDVEESLDEFRAAERKRGGFNYFYAEEIGGRTYHL